MARATRAACEWPLSLRLMMRYNNSCSTVLLREEGLPLLPQLPCHGLVFPLLPSHRCRWQIGHSSVWWMADRGVCQLEGRRCQVVRVSIQLLESSQGQEEEGQQEPCGPVADRLLNRLSRWRESAAKVCFLGWSGKRKKRCNNFLTISVS